MFDAYVRFRARVRPQALAIIAPQRWATYGELDRDVDRIGLALAGLGVAPGLGIGAVQIADHYLKHVVILALARLGVTSATASDPSPDFWLSDRETLDDPRRVRLTEDWFAAALAAEVSPDQLPAVERTPDQIGRVLLSSGTVGPPRRIAQTWRAIEGNARLAATTYLSGKDGRWIPFTGFDTSLGQSTTAAAWAVGATAVVGMRGDSLAEQLDALRPSVLALVPSHLRQLLADLPMGFPFQAGLRVVTTGSILPLNVAETARLRLTSDLQIVYGASECGVAAVADAAMLGQFNTLMGAPVPGTRVEVVDSEGHALPPGVQGELRISGERVAKGYLGDPDASARVFRHGGFYPGDLGRILPDGQLALDGRADERMNLGGHKFLPNLWETAALTCPGVVDCAAFAVPDPQGIEACWLAVVRGPGFDRDQLSSILKGARLPEVRFAWSEAIPRNAMGKIERERLRRETMAVLGLPPA